MSHRVFINDGVPVFSATFLLQTSHWMHQTLYLHLIAQSPPFSPNKTKASPSNVSKPPTHPPIYDVRLELSERPRETAKIDTFNAFFRSHLGYDDNYGAEESLDAANLERTKRQ